MIFIHHFCYRMMNFIHALPSDLICISMWLFIIQYSIFYIYTAIYDANHFNADCPVMIIKNHHLSAEVADFGQSFLCGVSYAWFIISKFLRMQRSIICCHLPMVSDVQNLFLWLVISCKGQKQIINRPCDTVSWSLQALLLLYSCLHVSFAWLPMFACQPVSQICFP